MVVSTVGELRQALSNQKDEDIVVIETTYLDTGDAIDLFPFYVDIIDGIKLLDGTEVSEVRFCQMDNK
jgi:hypothetical protein